MLKKNKILFISGPTNSGKSKLAMEIANRFNGEIINADSMQVYNELKILTARPSKNDEKNIKHHLYGHIKGSQRYNVYDWCNDCKIKIQKIINLDKFPIIVGGTGLYFHSLIKGMAKIPKIPESIKRKSKLRLEEIGLNNFIDEINNMDKGSLKKINKNDSQRLKRLWEVMTFSGIPLSQWQNNAKEKFIKNYNYNLILILPDKEILKKKCDKRFLRMIDDGAIKEVKKLKEKNYDQELPIMKAHGVPELIRYTDGALNLQEAIKEAQKSTRKYIKRQLTWWRGSEIKADKIFDSFPLNIDLNSLKIEKN